MPSPNTGFTAIAPGETTHSLGLKQDGSIVAWGHNAWGQCNVPSPNTGFTAIAAGGFHSLAIRPEAPPPPPQAAKVAYHSYSGYDNWDSRLYLLDLEGQEGKWISDDWNTVDHAMNAHFDPNGSRIVFMAVPKGEHEGSAWELYLWTIDSGEPVRLTDNGVRDEDPKFSPDGKWIVFKRDGRIHKMKAQRESGTNIPERLTNNSFEESMPYYTKDGTRRILYMSGAKSSADIRIVDEKGKTNDRYVANASVSGIQEYYPIAWHDDTFLYARWHDSANHNDQIYSCDISSGDIGSLAINTGYETVNNSDAYPMNLDYILFSSTRSGSNYDLFVGNVHTGEFWPITVYGGVNTTNEELGAACWPANISSEILVTLASHADLHVYDPEGRHTGIDYITNTVEESIPGSDFKILDEGGNEVPYDGHTPGEGLRQVIALPELQAGTYRIEIVGTSEGPFRVTVSGVQDGYTMTSQSYEGNIVKGVRLSTAVEMASVLDALTLIWEGQFALQLEPVIDFEPDTLNLKRQGKFVTAYIELPKGFDVSQIDVHSLVLNDLVSALPKPSEVGDYDGDGIADLMAKFDHQEVGEVLEPGIQMVVLTGQLNDETPLAGFDFVRVMGGKGAEATASQTDLAVPQKSVTAAKEKPQSAKDAADTDIPETFDPQEAVAFMLFEAGGIIDELGPGDLANEDSASELACAIDTVFAMCEEGQYIEALCVLETDILQRTDGCANIGEPDEDDWIRSADGQALVYPLVIETIELLESVI